MKLIISFRFLAVFAPLRGSTTFIFSSGETLAPVSEFSPPTITATNVDHPIHPDVRFIENPACKFGDVIVPARISSDFVISCESPDQDIIENNGNHSGVDSVSGASKVKFSVSLNGVDFFGDGLVYEYTKSPVVYSMSPRGNGGSVVVVRGKFFNPFHSDDFGISCQFGELMAKAVIVNDDKVTCVAPPQSEGTVQFRLVSQDLEILVNEFYDQTPLQYTYLPPVEIKSITPSFGTIHGNTMMLIELDWTAEHIQLRCIYGKNLASVVNVINGTMITCPTPPVKEPGWISFDIGIEDEENLTILTPISAQYRYVVEPTIKSIYPPRGAMSGGSLVTISGENFHYHDKQSVHCRFGNQTAPAVFATDNEVQCRSPAVDEITREVQAVRLVGEPIRDEVQEIRIVGTPIAREIQWIIVESSESREAPQVVRVLLTASTGMEGYFKLTYRGFASEPIGVKAAPEEVENCLTSGLFESVGVKRVLDESIYGDYSAFDVSFYSVPGGVDLADMSCDRSAVTSKWSGDIQCSIVEIVPSSTSLVDGSFQLTVFDFDGNELPIILSVESTAYYLEQKLSSFIGSDVSVTKSKWPFTSISKSGFIWMVTFPSFHHSSSRIPLADWPLITVEDISLSGTDTRLHAVEHVKGNWVEGSFSLSIDGIESDPIPFDSSADDVQAILNEIALVAGNVVVVQSSSLQGITWLCTFPGMGNVIDLVPNSDDLVGDLGIVTVKTISQGSDPLEGKFKLSFNGVLTDPISLPSSVLELKQKISVLPIGDFTISVETAFDNNYPHFQVENSFLITFTGFINDEQPLLSIDASWVSNGATILVERIRSLCCRVALSLNGVDYFSRNNEALIFSYDKKIAAVSIAPQFGSIEGGTGVNLTVIGLSHSTVESDSSTLYCVFGEVEVIGVLADDMTVSCIAPAYGIEATVMVGVKFNGKLSESRASFGFVPEPIIDFISPESLPSINISTVSIDVHGSNFDSRIPVFCHFQRILPSKDDSIQNRRIATEEPVKAIYHNNSLVQCPVQSWLTLQDFFSLQNQDWAKNTTLLEGAILEISLTTEQDWIHSHTIPYLPTETVISLFPRCAPRSGGTKIRVTGENFVETDSLACRFGSMNAELVRFISTKEIECITPQFNHFGSGAHVVEVQIANNGVDFSSSTESFEFYDHLIIENANPLFGEAQTVIEIYLDDNAMKTKALEKQPDTPSEPFNILSSYANPKCVFNHTDIVDAKVTSPTSLSCAAPLCRNPQGGGVLLQLSANYGFDVVDVGYFIYSAAQNVPFKLEPNHGRKGGGTRVLAKGIVGSFVRDVMPLCRFGSYTSRAVDINREEGYVVCISPPDSLNNFAPSVSVDISLSGQVFTNFSVVFRYDEEVVVRSLHPSRGFASGGTDIQVLGGPFANNHELKCRFGTNIVNASFHDTNHISCSSPTLDQVHEVQKISVFSMAHNPEIQTISAKSEEYVNEIHTCKTFGDGTDDLRDDEFGRGFILVAPGGSTNYPLKRATRWLRHNETAGTMHEALHGFMPDGFEVSRRGPFARETYEWDIILPKSATFGGETFHVVENGGGRVRLKGTNASANCTLSQAGTQKINGHFKLTFNQNGFEESTSPIRHNATNEEIERALERLEMIHDVIVNSNSIDINDTASGAYQWHITFNSLRNAGDLPLLKTDFASPDAKLSGTSARIEIIETRKGVSMDVLILTIPWNSEDFSILLNGVEGQVLHRGSSASDLQESMVLDFGIESVLVERYESKLNEQDEYYLLDIVGNSIAKDIKVITTGCIEDHSDCFEERRDVSLFSPGNASPFGGHFKIQYAGRITNPIPVFATPSDVESALEELESIGDILVTITESNRVDEYKVPVTSGHVGECRNFYIQFVQAISSPPEVMNGHKKPHLSTHYSGDLELLQLSEGQIMGVPTRDTAFSDDYQSSVCEVVKGVDYNHGGPVEFAVSINNGADFSMNNPIFHYHAIPTLDSIHPSLGSITGGTTIRVRGSNLLQGFIRSCIFWDTAKAGMAVMTPILEYTSQNEVTCQSPALIDSRNVTVFVV